MRAIRAYTFGGPDVLALDDVEPPAPGPGQVRVRIQAAGVNPVDTYVRSGTYAFKPPLPYTPGLDGGGIIDALGKEATGLSTGQRVYVAALPGDVCSGTYADMCVADARLVHPIPDRISLAQAAAVGVPYATAFRALFHKARAQPGETVFVHGASGGVGIAAVQLARAHGLRVVASAGSARGRELVKSQRADVVVDHAAPDYLDEVTAATGGRGPDVVLEMLADVNLGKDLTILARRGRIVVVGSRGDVTITPRLTMGKDAAIIGMALWLASADERASIHAAVDAGLANASLEPVVGAEMPLASAEQAHRDVLASGAHGRIVLIP